jgi:flagellar biosynthetic protein FlhB
VADKDSKTEEPTAKRQGDARSRGQVGVSKDLSLVVLLATSTMVMLSVLPWSMRPSYLLMRSMIEHPQRIEVGTPTAFIELFRVMGLTMGLSLAAPLAILVAAAVGSTVAQTGLLWATEKLQPNWSILNPFSGIKRLFSVSALVEFARGLVKTAIVVTAAFLLLKPDVERIEIYVGIDPFDMMGVLHDNLLSLMVWILAVLGAIGLLDYFYQKWTVHESLKMSQTEVKDEYKNAEGDPHIKNHIRKLRMTRARRRMLSAVPRASVVVTNPTHFAVALQYEAGSQGAPRVVAKGADFLAQRIREVAAEHDVPIIENAPLARTLYASVELDEEIKPEHYKAVAEVIGFVMRLQRAGLGRYLRLPNETARRRPRGPADHSGHGRCPDPSRQLGQPRSPGPTRRRQDDRRTTGAARSALARRRPHHRAGAASARGARRGRAHGRDPGREPGRNLRISCPLRQPDRTEDPDRGRDRRALHPDDSG